MTLTATDARSTVVVIEQDDSLVRSDRHELHRLARVAEVSDALTYRHQHAHDEPLLAVPDAAAWCRVRSKEWRRWIAPLSPLFNMSDAEMAQSPSATSVRGMMSTVMVAFVDVGGTLLPDTWPTRAWDRDERIARLCQLVPTLPKLRAAELVDSLSEVEHPSSLLQQTVPLVEEAVRWYGAEADVPPEAVIDAMCLPALGRVEPFPGAHELLAGLAQRARVVVVSNTMWRRREAQRRDFERFGLAGYVSDYVMSLDVGWRKPDRRFFGSALAAVSAPARRCVMVGDSEGNDIEPALALGMAAVRVAIEGPAPASSAALHVCRSLYQVAELLLPQYGASAGDP